MYSAKESVFPDVQVNLQELALLFMALANGALHNLELPPDDPIGLEYVLRAQQCLSLGSFLTKNTIAGIQTVVCAFSATFRKG
jgi:hypothetical protein